MKTLSTREVNSAREKGYNAIRDILILHGWRSIGDNEIKSRGIGTHSIQDAICLQIGLALEKSLKGRKLKKLKLSQRTIRLIELQFLSDELASFFGSVRWRCEDEIQLESRNEQCTRF